MQRVYPTSLRDVYEFWRVLLDMSSTLPRVSESCGDHIKGEVVCFIFSHHNPPNMTHRTLKRKGKKKATESSRMTAYIQFQAHA